MEGESRDEPREWPRERLIYRGLLIANIGVGDGEPVECPPVILLHPRRWPIALQC